MEEEIISSEETMNALHTGTAELIVKEGKALLDIMHEKIGVR